MLSNDLLSHINRQFERMHYPPLWSLSQLLPIFRALENWRVSSGNLFFPHMFSSLPLTNSFITCVLFYALTWIFNFFFLKRDLLLWFNHIRYLLPLLSPLFPDWSICSDLFAGIQKVCSSQDILCIVIEHMEVVPVLWNIWLIYFFMWLFSLCQFIFSEMSPDTLSSPIVADFFSSFILLNFCTTSCMLYLIALPWNAHWQLL